MIEKIKFLELLEKETGKKTVLTLAQQNGFETDALIYTAIKQGIEINELSLLDNEEEKRLLSWMENWYPYSDYQLLKVYKKRSEIEAEKKRIEDTAYYIWKNTGSENGELNWKIAEFITKQL